jgi:hypothetical protein
MDFMLAVELNAGQARAMTEIMEVAHPGNKHLLVGV